MPFSQASVPVSRVSGYARSRYSSYSSRRGYGRYRSKWSSINSRTNPVYPRPEVKNIDVQIGTLAAPQSIPNTGSITILNDIANNQRPDGRIGRTVATKSCYYNYVLNFGTGAVPNAIRHLLVWDRQSDGVVAALTDILTTAIAITAPLDLSNNSRFVILADERTTLSPNGDQIRICTGFRNINQRTTFDPDNMQLIPNTGALLAVFVSDEITVENQPTVYGVWRTRFIDN